jgi:hypothetical protein
MGKYLNSLKNLGWPPDELIKNLWKMCKDQGMQNPLSLAKTHIVLDHVTSIPRLSQTEDLYVMKS